MKIFTSAHCKTVQIHQNEHTPEWCDNVHLGVSIVNVQRCNVILDDSSGSMVRLNKEHKRIKTPKMSLSYPYPTKLDKKQFLCDTFL